MLYSWFVHNKILLAVELNLFPDSEFSRFLFAFLIGEDIKEFYFFWTACNIVRIYYVFAKLLALELKLCFEILKELIGCNFWELGLLYEWVVPTWFPKRWSALDLPLISKLICLIGFITIPLADLVMLKLLCKNL